MGLILKVFVKRMKAGFKSVVFIRRDIKKPVLAER